MVAQKPASKKAGKRAEGVALLPGPSVLAKLSSADRELLERLVASPIDYVPDPTFEKRGTERALFGAVARLQEDPAATFQTPPAIVERESVSGELVTMKTAQEQLAFRRLNYSRYRGARIIDRHAGRRLTRSAAWRLIAWGKRSLEARRLIVRLNMPLVLAMAKRTRLVNIDINEMISEGNMALLRSVEKFDCSRGFKFSTYACRAILKSFSRVAMRMSRYRRVFPTEFDPAVERSDFIDRRRETLEEDCIDEVRRILIGNTAELSDVERTVLVERFALGRLGDGSVAKTKTLEQVGNIIGVTKERVRQIQNKALGKLRDALMEDFLAA